MEGVFPGIPNDSGISSQAVMQIISLAVTLGMALIGGLIVGKKQGTIINL